MWSHDLGLFSDTNLTLWMSSRGKDGGLEGWSHYTSQICNEGFMSRDRRHGEYKVNKYAIYAYTHGPVTGSGPSVKPLKYDVAPYWLS